MRFQTRGTAHSCTPSQQYSRQAHSKEGAGGHTPPKLPKGPVLATQWTKNGVFVGWLSITAQIKFYSKNPFHTCDTYNCDYLPHTTAFKT